MIRPFMNSSSSLCLDIHHHITLNQAKKITLSVYAQPINSLQKTFILKDLVKHHNNNVLSVKIMGFRVLLRYQSVVTLL